jgi:hypothetical protein
MKMEAPAVTRLSLISSNSFRKSFSYGLSSSHDTSSQSCRLELVAMAWACVLIRDEVVMCNCLFGGCWMKGWA